MVTPDGDPVVIQQGTFVLIDRFVSKPVGFVGVAVEGWLVCDDEIGAQFDGFADDPGGRHERGDDAVDGVAGATGLDGVDGIFDRIDAGVCEDAIDDHLHGNRRGCLISVSDRGLRQRAEPAEDHGRGFQEFASSEGVFA